MRFRSSSGLLLSPAIPLAALALGTGHLGPGALPRSTSDRPDDFQGAQVHVVYVLPSDGVDRSLDTDRTIAASVSNFQTWLRGQTGGRGLRVDTFQGEVDVSFARLGQTDAELAAKGLYLRDAIEQGLVADGFDAPGKLYAVYYDGSDTAACGGGAWPPALVGTVAAVYMRATYDGGFLCYDPTLSRSGLQLMDLAVLHELMHTMGFVPKCAPHQVRAGHVSDSPDDLMYAGNQPWTPSILDVGHDDYFEAHISGCPDLSNSAYLASGSTPPPPPPPTQCVVPRVVGLPLGRARAAIARAHCSLGRVTRRFSARRPGLVVGQTPKAGRRFDQGRRVNVTVSRGRRNAATR